MLRGTLWDSVGITYIRDPHIYKRMEQKPNMKSNRLGTVAIAAVIVLGVIVVGSAFFSFMGVILSLYGQTEPETVQQVYAEKSPYDSGYDHGCDDAGEDPDDRYINEDGKGPSYHTNEFMSGYNNGYDSCSGRGSSSGSSNDRGDNGDDGDIIGDTCNFVQDNGVAAELLGTVLGLPTGTASAVNGLCSIGN